MNEKFWHIAQFTGFNSNNIIKISQKLKNKFGEDCVFCPIVKERRYNGKKRAFYELDVPLFFGYVFLKTEFDPGLGPIIEREIAPRCEFLSFEESTKWAYVTDEDIDRLRRENSSLISKEEVLDTTLSMGDVVRFKSGPFCNFTGRILAVFPSKNTAKVMTAVFKKETSVEVPLNTLERI